jgi:hypothetical protein
MTELYLKPGFSGRTKNILNFQAGQYSINGNAFHTLSDGVGYGFDGDIYQAVAVDKAKIFDEKYWMKKAKEFNGTFWFIAYDISSKKVIVITDRLGKSFLYYHISPSGIFISNDFWSVVSNCKPSFSDINISLVAEHIVHNRTFDNLTTINGIKTTSPGSMFTFKSGELEIRKYWKIIFQPNYHLNAEEAGKLSVTCFKKSLAVLSEQIPESKIVGLGLSGGLDSRLLFELWSKSRSIDLYAIGKSRTSYGLRTRGAKIAERIAEDASIRFVDPMLSSASSRIAEDILKVPEYSSQFEVTIPKMKKPDVVLNGEHGGVLFGEFDFAPVAISGTHGLSDYILKFLSFRPQTKLISYNRYFGNISSRVQTILDTYDSKNPYESFYKFFFEEYGSKARQGFFESLHTKSAYSPFTENNFFEFYLSFPSYLTFDRIVQKELFKSLSPNLGLIVDESHEPPLLARGNTGRDIVIRAAYRIYGLMTSDLLSRGEVIRKSGMAAALPELMEIVCHRVPQFSELWEHSSKSDINKIIKKEHYRLIPNIFKRGVLALIIADQAWDEPEKYSQELCNRLGIK